MLVALENCIMCIGLYVVSKDCFKNLQIVFLVRRISFFSAIVSKISMQVN